MSNFVPDFPYLKKKKEIKKKVTLLILAELQIHKKLTRMVQRFFFSVYTSPSGVHSWVWYVWSEPVTGTILLSKTQLYSHLFINFL